MGRSFATNGSVPGWIWILCWKSGKVPSFLERRRGKPLRGSPGVVGGGVAAIVLTCCFPQSMIIFKGVRKFLPNTIGSESGTMWKMSEQVRPPNARMVGIVPRRRIGVPSKFQRVRVEGERGACRRSLFQCPIARVDWAAPVSTSILNFLHLVRAISISTSAQMGVCVLRVERRRSVSGFPSSPTCRIGLLGPACTGSLLYLCWIPLPLDAPPLEVEEVGAAALKTEAKCPFFPQLAQSLV